MPRITKEEFVWHMNHLVKAYMRFDEVDKAINKVIRIDDDLIELTAIEAMIELLSEMADDIDDDIKYYVLEKECKGFEWRDNENNVHHCRTTGDLWEVINYGKDGDNQNG